MTLHPELKALLNQTIYVAALSGIAGRDFTYGTPVAASARVEHKRTIALSPSGDEIISDTMIFTEQAIGSHDRVWLPGEDQNDDTLARLPKLSMPVPDEDGSVSHYEVAV